MKKVEEKVILFIEKHRLIEPGDKILVALSGGPDSVFLLHFLQKYKKKYDTEIAAIHINHKLRGNDADEDEKFCKSYCGALNVPFSCVGVDVDSFAKKNKISFEEAGRILRYEIIENHCREIRFNKIATGHNLTDNSETVLLNVIKGSGLKGLAGIPAVRENIIRPMLTLSKDEIVRYLEKEKIGFRTDGSNFDTDYQRNFIREGLLPQIREKLNPKVDNSLFNLSRTAKDYYSYFEKKIVRELKKENPRLADGELSISVRVIKKLEDKGIPVSEVIRTAVLKYFKIEFNFKDVENIISLLNSSSGKKINLKQNLNAIKEREHLHLFFSKKEIEKSFEIKIGETITVFQSLFSAMPVEKKEMNFTRDKNVEFVDAGKIKNPLIIRRWKNGDIFHPLGLKGSKTVSDFLCDQKISSRKKKEQLVLEHNGTIVWVVGLRLSEDYKVINSSKEIIKLEIR